MRLSPAGLRLLRLATWPDYRDANGCTALRVASESGRVEIARLLCEAGAAKDRAD